MLQDPIETEKLTIAQADPEFQRILAEYYVNPVKDIELTSEERAAMSIPLYSLSEIYPDFKDIFKPIRTLQQEIKLTSLCGSVERLHERFRFDFTPTNADDLDVLEAVRKVEANEYDSKKQPIRVHAIPFQQKYEGFVADGATIVAASKLAGRETIWAEITFYKQRKGKR